MTKNPGHHSQWPAIRRLPKHNEEFAHIYGLPIVMNYAIMYDYAVDKNSGQFKAPFKQIHSLHHVAT